MTRHSDHPGRLRTLLAAGAVLGMLAAAPAAHAATVSSASGKVTFTAARGEANHLTIAPWGMALKVTDTGTKSGVPIALTAGSGCLRLSSTSAACSGTSATVNLGDGDDAVDLKDGVADSLTCGPGADSGEAETGDTVAPDCETVTKPAPPADPGTIVEPPIDPPVIEPPVVIDPPVIDPAVVAPPANSVPPAIPPQTVGISASGVARVLVACPADSGGCKGIVRITLPSPSSQRHAKAVAAKASAAITIGSARFKAAAGTSKSVPVRLSKRGRQRILRRRHRRARITVTTRSATGATVVTSQDVALRLPSKAKRHKAPRR